MGCSGRPNTWTLRAGLGPAFKLALRALGSINDCRWFCPATSGIVVVVPRYCQHCILPESRPGVLLDREGVCNACRNNHRKGGIDWHLRAEQFRELVAHAKRKSKGYDCLIPVSGGKDSYWQVHTCLEHGLRPLCMTYRFPGRTPLGSSNLAGLVRMGVDHFDFTVNPRVEREFVLRAFRRLGISGLPAHMGIYSAPVNLALRFEIPLIVYGENSAFEYGSEREGLAGSHVDREWLKTFGVTGGTTAADWVGDGLTAEDLQGYTLPSEDLLIEAGVQAVFMGHFFSWDPETSLGVATSHGFHARNEGARVGHLDYVNIDDDFIAIHHHPKWHKFGITRSWDTLSMEIRAGRLTREAAIERLRTLGDETPTDDIRLFCEYLGISELEYHVILEGFRNRDLWSRVGGRWVIRDFLVPDYPWPADPLCLSNA
jgi:N-acetyl sugar amidotransferase